MGRIYWAGIVLAIAIAMGLGFEQAQRRRDRDRLPQVGRSFDAGGRRLNLFCSGEGSPTVVLESDALMPGYAFVAVQRAIAKSTRACWYDRAGYGWSDPAPAPHDSLASARDLHTLLKAAGVPPPYVLAGVGFGAFNVRVYCGLYPNEVAGVVLADAQHEDQWEHERGGMSRVPFGLGYPPDLVLRAASAVGLMRLAPHRKRFDTEGLSTAEQATLAELASRPNMRAAFLAEQGFSAAPREAHAAGDLGDRPLAVVSSEPGEFQEKLAELSSRGRVMGGPIAAAAVVVVREAGR